MNSEIERECVRALLQDLGKEAVALESPNPPAPDVIVRWRSGITEAFEVTEVHPDEVPAQGSATREREERRARAAPGTLAMTWLQTESMPAILHRAAEKTRRASSYELGADQPLSLLLVGTLRLPTALAATFVVPETLNVARLNEGLHEALDRSRFTRAYLHLQLQHVLWEWNRPDGWRVVRTPQPAESGWSTIAELKREAGPGGLPRAKIVGSWP